jgi:hypothetical protein
MSELKLLAFDAEDLQVISAHLQDAVLRPSDMIYQKRQRRFALVANRFDWAAAAEASRSTRGFIRRRAGLRIEHVGNVVYQGIDLSRAVVWLALLALSFVAEDVPGGTVRLDFAGGGAIRLAVDCLEVSFSDLGAAWSTDKRPAHPDDSSDGEPLP